MLRQKLFFAKQRTNVELSQSLKLAIKPILWNAALLRITLPPLAAIFLKHSCDAPLIFLCFLPLARGVESGGLRY